MPSCCMRCTQQLRNNPLSAALPANLQVPIDLSAHWRPVRAEGLPAVFTGGWVGYTGYDTVRYVYSGGH